jgi:signal transduction histidine kinase/ActR/RegA family two-component response regulator
MQKELLDIHAKVDENLPPAQAARLLELTRIIAEAQSELRALTGDDGQDEIRERDREIHLLNRVISAGAAMQDLQMTLDAVVREIALGFDVPRAGLALLEESGAHLRLASEYLPPDAESSTGMLIPIEGNPATEYVMYEKAPLAIIDAQTDPRMEPVHEMLRARGIVSMLLVPLVARNRVLGTLGLDSFEPRLFTSREIRLATNIATTVAHTIDNAQLMDMTRRRAVELSALEVVAIALRNAVVQEEVMPAILSQLVKLADARDAFLVLQDEVSGDLFIKLAYGDMQKEVGLRFPAKPSITGRVMEQKRPVIISSVPAEPDFAFSSSPSDDYAAAVIPLVVRERSIGAVWLVRDTELSSDNLLLLTTISDIAASAIHRSILYEQLQGQAQRLQRIMETVNAGLLLIDRDRRIVLANPTARRDLVFLTGNAHPEPLTQLGGRLVEEFLPDEDSTMESRHIEFEFFNPERRVYAILANSMLANEVVDGWVMLLRDVTYRRDMQERILQQDRLAAVGQLAAGIAHDFNNIVAVIVLYTQMLQASPRLSEGDRRRIRTIDEQAHHAANLIRQILDFSRQSPMERQVLDLDPFLAEMVKLWQRTLAATIQIELVADAGSHVTFGAPSSLQQALMNLVLNARDAMPLGGRLRLELARVHLSSSESPPLPDLTPGDWLRLTIADSGEGIPEVNLPRIFDPFFTTKGPNQGTGLGLAQVYGIVKQHEGQIAVESTVGRGTTFVIYLPAWAESQAQGDSASAVDESLTGHEVVMVVEDDTVTRLAVQHLLESQGYRVLAAKNGREALTLLYDGEAVDLILSDLVMPELGGAELYTALRNHFPSTRMLMMTGYPLHEQVAQMAELRALDWLQKPFSINDLCRRVRSALDGTERKQPA